MLRKRFSNKYIGNSYPEISNKQRIRDPLRISYSLFTQIMYSALYYFGLIIII